MTSEDVWSATTANRLLAADLLAGLTSEQWAMPSLCAGWTIRELAGHMLMPVELGARDLLVGLVRARGNLDRAVDGLSRRLAQRPTEQIVASLRAGATARTAPPRVGPYGPFTDSCVHLRDAARPLGLDVSPAPDVWRRALDFLTSTRARTGFVPRGRLDGLRLRATDQDWAWGTGAPVSGPSEAVAMAACGRTVALENLGGAGVDVLRDRLR